MLRVLDLFSGIGGFSLGLERTGGFRTVAFCEIDEYNRWHLRRRWPGVPIFDDVCSLKANHIVEGVDLICGGFPCQDISNSGRRVGIEGERSGLWAEFSRLIGEFRPRYAIVENVAAINGRGLGRVLGDLTSLGYDAEWHVIPAQSLGAPHERERCWIVAHPQGESRLYQPHIAKAAARLLADAPPWGSCPWDSAAACLCRVDDGIPDRVVDTERFGNSVLPQIPEIFGRALLEAEAQCLV
jgi:DNA (cytosine-5)-methyltransferase 1